MKTTSVIMLLLISILSFNSCNDKPESKKVEIIVPENTIEMMPVNDQRISLELNPMQKQHQLKNMRSHLEAVQTIILLLSKEQYDEASEVAYIKLGSTTEMKMMCASFGNEQFENLGLDFHKSADKMSEIFKNKDKNSALEALSNTMNYCVQCHSLFKQ